jgi:hypothetical protein
MNCRHRLLCWAIECDDYRPHLQIQALSEMYGMNAKALTMQRKQPIHPKNVRVSLRNREERIAQMTTDRAPIGVTTTASTKAYAIDTMSTAKRPLSKVKRTGEVAEFAHDHHCHTYPP